MPARSKAQQIAAGVALSARRGKKTVGKLKGASKSMYASMSEKELAKMASTPHKGKPRHVKDKAWFIASFAMQWSSAVAA
ncbi:DUF3008 family protein [Cupriavidus malaysiensis]|uniref:DUF3008 domain-containing protein n=1 Tax=Cupriavidus malaysiensis TaxID=367825 RepID=A0ABM6FFC6_9BURK|nr:DUF3008 family protein [Cupriavidus malaysiensis]AOZ10604.1 DUF3008 domain-containing protein [Cupriavidus malaysiensis]